MSTVLVAWFASLAVAAANLKEATCSAASECEIPMSLMQTSIEVAAVRIGSVPQVSSLDFEQDHEPDDVSGGPIIMCEYEKADEVLSHPYNGLHKEPDRVFSPQNWEVMKHGQRDPAGDMADYAYTEMAAANEYYIGPEQPSWLTPRSRLENQQLTRLNSLRKVWSVIPEFFAQVLPDVNWWISSGSLIGALRNGGTIPWDTDGDMAVDLNGTYNTEETFKIFLQLAGGEANATWTDGRWREESERFLMVPMPSAIVGSGDIAFFTQPLPTSDKFMGRFVDMETGFFVEIIDEGQFGDAVYPLQQCVHDGTFVNAPNKPALYLDKMKDYSASDFSYGGGGEETIGVYTDQYTCQRCEAYELVSEERQSTHQSTHARDNFKLALVPAGTLNGKETWVSVDSADVAAVRSCTSLIGSAKPEMLDVRTSCLKLPTK